MKLQRTENAKKGILFGTISNFYSMIMPFLMRTVLLYTLGVNYLGLHSLFGSVLQVLNLAELGVGSAMVFSMYKPIAEDDDEKICALMRLYKIYYRIIGLVILVVGVAITPFIPNLISGDVPDDINLYILYHINLASTVLTYWMFAYKNSLITAFQRRDVLSKIALLTNTLKYVLQILALVVFRDYYIYTVVFVVTQVVNNVVTAIVSDRMFPKYKPRNKLPKEEIKAINQRVKDLFITKIGSVINSSSDTIIISAFMGLTVLAIYQNYYYVLSVPLALANVVFESCRAGIGNSLETESREKNLNDLFKFTFLIGWVTCICCCGLIALFQHFMTMWVGADLLVEMPVVILFIVYFFVLIFGRLLDCFKDSAGIWHKDRFRALCAALFNLVSNLIMVQFIGLYGILLSSIFSYIFVSLPWEMYNLFSLVYGSGLKKYLLLWAKIIVLTVLAAAISYLVCSFLPESGIIWFLVKGVIALVISNAVILGTNFRSKEFRQCVPLIKNMLHIK